MDDQEKWRADLQSLEVCIRAAAAENLCYAATDSAGAAVELVTACGDEDEVQIWAVAALESLGPPPLETSESLAKLAKQTNPLVAYWAATLLGRLGPAATASQNELAMVLSQSKDNSVQERAAWALGKIGANSEDAVTALQNASESEDARLARLAQNALSQMQS